MMECCFKIFALILLRKTANRVVVSVVWLWEGLCVCDLLRGQVGLQLSQWQPDDFTRRGPPSERREEMEGFGERGGVCCR